MDKKSNYIVLRNKHVRLSDVLNDCADLCVPTKKDESLASILKKMCAQIESKSSVSGTSGIGNSTTSGTSGTSAEGSSVVNGSSGSSGTSGTGTSGVSGSHGS